MKNQSIQKVHLFIKKILQSAMCIPATYKLHFMENLVVLFSRSRLLVIKQNI